MPLPPAFVVPVVDHALKALRLGAWVLGVHVLTGAALAQEAAPRKAAPAQASHTTKAAKTANRADKAPAPKAAKAKAASSPSSSKRAVAQGPAKGRPAGTSPKLAKAAPAAPTRPSYGQLAGLHAVDDPLDLRSSVALVIDQDTQEVLFRKNDQAVLPIASITKLMTGLVVAEAQLPLGDAITITQDDVDTEKGSRSRLAVGSVLSRGELLHLALMSSENRAAHALGRTFPGGMGVFVQRMNARAQSLGMNDTRYVEPTGLSSRNQSSAQDLATLVSAAYKEPLLREMSTSHGREVEVGRRVLHFNNTNRLVKSPQWDIGLQKTGYISEAGQCLVMQAQVAGRKLIMVFLDSAGKLSRIADAERVRRWLEAQGRPASFSVRSEVWPRS